MIKKFLVRIYFWDGDDVVTIECDSRKEAEKITDEHIELSFEEDCIQKIAHIVIFEVQDKDIMSLAYKV